jgi:hypothetical protein
MMQKVLRSGKLLAGSLALVLLASGQASADLLNNGSFETGTFSNWSQTGGSTNFTFVEKNSFDGYTPQLGSYFAALGPLSTGYLSQSFATTVGQAYTVTWNLAVNDGRSPQNGFQAFWNATNNSSSITMSNNQNFDTAGGNYATYSFTEVATTSNTTLEFAFYDVANYIALDNVSVNAVSAPEPSTAVVGLVGGLAMTGYLWRARRRARAAA